MLTIVPFTAVVTALFVVVVTVGCLAVGVTGLCFRRLRRFGVFIAVIPPCMALFAGGGAWGCALLVHNNVDPKSILPFWAWVGGFCLGGGMGLLLGLRLTTVLFFCFQQPGASLPEHGGRGLADMLHSRRLFAVVLASAVVVVFCAAWFSYRVATHGPGPGWGFRPYTGLQWPFEARIVRYADSHGGFLGDGEEFLVFDVNPATLQGWLAGAAPWGKWQRGPIPDEIGNNCQLSGWGRSDNNRFKYSGDEELDDLMSRDRIWYSARDRNRGSIPWHNGDLLVVDPQGGRVWLSAWDW